MDDLLADFVAETREMLEAIAGELVSWEQDPGDRARLDSIFRFVHTVKGNCGFFDFPRLETLSHAAESALEDVRCGHRTADAKLVSAVLAITDRIASMTTAIEAGQDIPEGDDHSLITALNESTYNENTNQAGPAPTAKPSQLTAITPRTIRLPVELLDRVMSGVSDMVLARNDLARRLRDAGNEPTLDGPFERLSAILTDVRGAITRMRMQQIEHLYSGLPRLVRDLSAELGKQVVIDAEGGAVELDREMVEMIRDPITHLIRNAIGHGIEPPEIRLAAGKPAVGNITISSQQSGNTITITLTDDGAGLDVDKIGRKAVAGSLLSSAELEALPDENIINLIFEAGLSTADSISPVSGRGVGLDIVRSNIEKIGGTIEVLSTAGGGTSFLLHLPLTLSIISALTVSVAGQTFAIPHSYLVEIAHGKSATVAFSQVGETDLVTFRDRRIPCLTLGNILGLSDRRAGDDQRLIMLKLGGGEIFTLAVDQIHSQEDLVIKPVCPAIMQTGLYAGTALLDNGQPVLMLDIPSVARAHDLLNTSKLRAVQQPAKTPHTPDVPQRTFMTFTDLAGRSRAISMDLVTRIELIDSKDISTEGEQTRAVINEQIVTLAGVDNAPIPEGEITLLRLSDSETELAYPVQKIGHSVDCKGALTPDYTDPAIEGVALIDSKAVPVIDAFALFAGLGKTAPLARQLSCHIPSGDSWASRILAPLVSAAGYTVCRNTESAADVMIMLDSQQDAASTPARPTILVHSNPDLADAQPNTVYRYDRAGLLDALHRAKVECLS